MNEKAIAEKATPKKPQPKKLKIKKGTGTVICIVLMIVMAAAALMLFQSVVFNGAEALKDGYSAAYEAERESAYQALYQKYYDSAESAHHVSNRASIYIGNIRETEKLEVLKVSDVEFIVEDSGNNSGNITSCPPVPAKSKNIT